MKKVYLSLKIQTLINYRNILEMERSSNYSRSSVEREQRRYRDDRSPNRYKSVDRNYRYSRSRSPYKRKDITKNNFYKSSTYRESSINRHQKDSKHRHTQEEEFFDKRRQERELLGIQDCPHIWSKSPLREELVKCDYIFHKNKHF